jgi:hypothetical protein
MDARPQCEFTKANGDRCRAKALPGKALCFAHDRGGRTRRKRRKGSRPAALAARATKAEVAKRVEAVLRLRLAGAQFHDLVEFSSSVDAATGKEDWQVSTGQLRKYITASNDLMTAEMESRRTVLLARHIAQRTHLYARTMAQGDYRVALAVLVDEAKLERLYSPEFGTGLLEAFLAYLPPDLAAGVRDLLAEQLSSGRVAGNAGPPTPNDAGGDAAAGPAAPGPEPHPGTGRNDPGSLAGDVAPLFPSPTADVLFEAERQNADSRRAGPAGGAA